MDELDGFLEGLGQPAEAVDEPVAQEPEGAPRDEKGRFAPKQTGDETPQEAAEPVPPTEQKDQLPPETFKGLREEREKRQALERELQALKDQLVSKTQEPPAPPPSIWEDEQGYSGHIVNTAVQQATLNAKLDMSEMMVRQANPDFEDVKAKFLELAQINPGLYQQALADPHPWNRAYVIAKNAMKAEELGAANVTELEAKLREQIMAELQTQATPPAAAPALPNSLAAAQSGNVAQAPSAPLTLKDILGG